MDGDGNTSFFHIHHFLCQYHSYHDHIIVIIIVVRTRSWIIFHICQMTFILYEFDSEEIGQEMFNNKKESNYSIQSMTFITRPLKIMTSLESYLFFHLKVHFEVGLYCLMMLSIFIFSLFSTRW